ncbi:MAG: non-ribosomal peptide synthetase [Nitratireductor sp.]|nr:non-ribosomal peptide synthetase [Nitratireductor sp.]
MSVNSPDILSLLKAQAAARGDAHAIETPDGTATTYRELHDRVVHIASAIAQGTQSKRGGRPRIGLVFPNGAEMAVALLAASIAGEAAPFNPSSKPAELDAYFRACGLDALVMPEGYDGPAVSIAEKSGLCLLRLKPGAGIAGAAAGKAPLETPAPDDIALVLMTSGSTGRPKIVPLSHRNVCTSAADVCRSMALGPEDRCLLMWEQYHIGGLVDLLMAPIASGGCIIATGGFNAPLFFELLGKAKPTWYQGVPTTLNELVILAQRNSITAKPSSLRLLRSVAAALPPKLMGELEDLFGLPVIQTFGMTEAGPLIRSTALPPAVRKPGSVGRSCGTQIRIVGPQGQSLPAGETGEVAIRGDNVFAGYEGDPETNAKQFRDGWFHTGDTGYLDADGDLFLTGRIKQLINRGGEKVNPQEVDDALLTHPAVSEAASFAIPHKTLGEDVSAAVVLRENISPEELRSFLLERLATFKVPHLINIMDALPRNPVGKVDRLALAEAAAASLAQGGSHAPPRNRLEEFLVRLWQKELGVSEVGIHDDFAILGGDSLSSLRVVTAAEATLGITMPDDIFDHFSPISRLSERLEQEGVDPTMGGEDSTGSDMSEGSIGDALEKTGVGSTGSEEDIAIALERMAAGETRRDFQIAADAITLYRTPAELRTALEQIPAFSLSGGGSLTGRMRNTMLRWRWRNDIKQQLDASPSAGKWMRRKLNAGAMLYEAPTGSPRDKTLIVGFGGNYMRLMVPTYRVLCSLDPEATDLLLLSDASRAGFIGGLPGLGTGLAGLENWLEDFVMERDCGKVVALGTSGGGIAAIHAAIGLGWRRVVAVGAATPSRHADMAAVLRAVAGRHDPSETEVVLAFSAGNVRDSDAAAQIKGILPEAAMRPDRRFKDHNLIDKLYHAGELERFLEALTA